MPMLRNPIKEGMDQARFRDELNNRLDATDRKLDTILQKLDSLTRRVAEHETNGDRALGELMTLNHQTSAAVGEIATTVKELMPALMTQGSRRGAQKSGDG